MSEEVHGYCPMGCGKTLFVGAGGHITCSYVSCPQPDAVSVILERRETEHIVHFTEDGWTVLHPLRDFVDGDLLNCPATAVCEALQGPPVQPGNYRMVRAGDGWHWQPVELVHSLGSERRLAEDA